MIYAAGVGDGSVHIGRRRLDGAAIDGDFDLGDGLAGYRVGHFAGEGAEVLGFTGSGGRRRAGRGLRYGERQSEKRGQTALGEHLFPYAN
jgi:hypothetical protein